MLYIRLLWLYSMISENMELIEEEKTPQSYSESQKFDATADIFMEKELP